MCFLTRAITRGSYPYNVTCLMASYIYLGMML